MFVFRKFGLLCFLVTLVLIFAFLPHCRRFVIGIIVHRSLTNFKTCLYYMVAFLCVGLYDHVLGRSYY